MTIRNLDFYNLQFRLKGCKVGEVVRALPSRLVITVLEQRGQYTKCSIAGKQGTYTFLSDTRVNKPCEIKR